MVLPEYIKESIKRAGKHNKIASRNNEIVRKWLENNYPNYYWEDHLIDCLELANNGSNELIRFLESDCDGLRVKNGDDEYV